MKINIFLQTHLCRRDLLKVLVSLLIIFASCTKPVARSTIEKTARTYAYDYALDLTTPEDGLFKVTLFVKNLGSKNNVFRFAGAGPYHAIDFGQIVHVFKAFDNAGNEVPTRRIDRTRWQLGQPQRIAKIYYEIADTRHLPDADAGGKNQRPVEMLGTTLMQDFAFISGQGVFGFLQGWERAPMRLRIDCPADWQIGTALQSDEAGYFYAQNFGQLASTPILTGYLSETSERILGSDVYFYTYSKTDKITSDDLLPLVNDVLNATDDFLNGKLPIDDYTMLFLFEYRFAGGVEYYNSSAFVFAEDELANIRGDVQDVIAHEYFHLVIPFSIRSDAVNFDDFFGGKPTAQLWFFEGVTEWASDIIQLRSGLKSLKHYILQDFRDKMIREALFGSEVSLRDMSLAARGNPREYANVYSRGALVAALLDIHLLDLTNGRRGLRDVINDLILDFGKDRPLPEEQFFEILIDYCGPEFEDFIRRYIIGNAPLPYKEMLEKVGIIYQPERPAAEAQADFGIVMGVTGRDVVALKIEDEATSGGVRKGDVIRRINGRVITPANFQNVVYRQLLPRMDIGESYTLEALRNGRRMRITGETIRRKDHHLFSLPRMLTPSQQRVRDAWLNRNGGLQK